MNVNSRNTGNPQTDKLFNELDQAILDVLDVPEGYFADTNLNDNRSKTTSLRYANDHYTNDYEKPISEAKKIKAEKIRRVELYTKQIGDATDGNCEGEIEYDVNEHLQNNAFLRFAAAAVKSGLITFEEEE